MGYKLCTAEKPSVARDIAKVVGANDRQDGYYIGNGYIVTWAVGHLVGLAEPEEYGYTSKNDMWDKEKPECKQKAYEELPILPNDFKTIVLKPTKKQFQIMKELMHRDDVDYIIDCGDMGPEGHILQWFIREKAGNKKAVQRFCATSMTEEAILKSMANLRNASEFNKVILGEFCKKRADWIMGMSMSRCASIKYNARVDVGRVQSPTLYFVVKRFIEVNNFKATDYYQLQAEFLEGFKTFWLKDTDNRFNSRVKDENNRLLDKIVAEKTAQEVKGFNKGIITALELKKRATDRPQLYDITELQRDGNRLFGYTASDVLATAQALYETHKVLSYPRTDSRYITSDLQPYMKIRLEQISSIQQYSEMANNILSSGLNIDKKIIDDSKVTDHHALIVTEKIQSFDLSKLNNKEENILHLVITRMLVSFSHKYTYDETIINVTFDNGMIFAASGKKPVSLGWKAVQKNLMGKEVSEEEEDKENENEQLFPNIQKGQVVNIKDVKVLSKRTTPPKLHTEATLLTAMENAGNTIENGAILKGKGIGTQATRAAIIKSLFDKHYVVNKKNGKTNYLIPTKQGINTIKVIPTDLYSPKITADWEEKIAKIITGELTESDFMEDFKEFIRYKVREVKQSNIEGDFSLDSEQMGECPWCKKAILKGHLKKEGKKAIESYYCSAKCGFSITKDNIIYVSRTKKNLTTAQIKKLISTGSIEATCVNKNNAEYKGSFKLVKSPKGYTALEFDFVNEYKKKKSYN